jgi:diamine N-acetyltransferase
MTAWRNDADLVKDLGSIFRYIDHEVDIEWFNAYMAGRKNNVRLAICESESRRIIGVTHLLGIDWANRSADFGIFIGERSARGEGAGEFATRGILKHAFMDLNLHRVYLTALADNERAIRLYRKAGFVEEGRLRQAVFKNGGYADMLQMAILSHEYRQAAAREGV